MANSLAAFTAFQTTAFGQVSIATRGRKNLPAQLSNITSGSYWELGDSEQSVGDVTHIYVCVTISCWSHCSKVSVIPTNVTGKPPACSLLCTAARELLKLKSDSGSPLLRTLP